jgi:hypothetical protein
MASRSISLAWAEGLGDGTLSGRGEREGSWVRERRRDLPGDLEVRRRDLLSASSWERERLRRLELRWRSLEEDLLEEVCWEEECLEEVCLEEE